MTLSNSPGERPPDRPIGFIIRRKRRSLGWSIEKLTTKYLINLGRLDRDTNNDSLDIEDHPLAINNADIGRLERGESVRITIAKLRLLCQTLMFSQEETVRILARAQGETTLIDLDEEVARVLEALYFAITALSENPLSKLSISQQLGNRKVDDVPQQEVLSIVRAAIEEVQAPRRLKAASAYQRQTPVSLPTSTHSEAIEKEQSPDNKRAEEGQHLTSKSVAGPEISDATQSAQDAEV